MGLTIVRFIFYGLAVLTALAAVVFIMRALIARSMSLKKVYGVARQNERQRMMLYAYYSVGLFILGLIFVGIGSLTLLRDSDPAMAEIEATNTPAIPTENVEAPTLTATAEPDVAETATEAAPPAVVEDEPTATVSSEQPTAPEAPPTDESTVTELTPTATTAALPPSLQDTATVNSPIVGLYLRVEPSGEILERLEDQSVVTLLNEQQTVDGIEWLKVVSISGNEGWVAAEFLVLPTP